jgi:squalene-associated FAD-dependent desaturase
MTNKVIIVGGGVAGISAAVELAKSNIPVQLIEAKNYIGGRCFSFVDRFTGDEIDNGQHIFIGAYHNFFELLDNIGTRKFIIPQKKFEISYFKDSEKAKLVASGLRSRLPLLLGLIRFRLLDLKSKLRIINLIMKSQKISFDQSISALELLYKYNQTKEAINIFWEPLIMATLNQSIERSPADIFLEVVRKMFSSQENAKIYFSSVGLSRLFAPAENFLEARNSKILKNTRIQRIEISSNKVVGCYDKSDTFYPAKALIFAVPFDVLDDIFRNSDLEYCMSNFNYSTIISYYFWTKKPINCNEINALIGTNSHWIFNRSLYMQNLNTKYFNYTITISNANKIAKLERKVIENMIISDLMSLNLLKNKEDIIHSKLIIDKKATVALDCKNNAKRHPIFTEFNNMFVCGDWTSTGLPATVEGAALSGKLAANYLKNCKSNYA